MKKSSEGKIHIVVLPTGTSMIGTVTKVSNGTIEITHPCYMYEYTAEDGSRHLALNNAMAFSIDPTMIIDLDRVMACYETSAVINEFYLVNLRYYHQHLKPTYYSRIATDSRNIAEALSVLEKKLAENGGIH